MKPAAERINYAVFRGVACVAAFIAALSWVAAQPEPADVLTPQRVAELRVVLNAVISPDGTAVAYVLAVPRRPFKDQDGPAWTELHVTDTSGVSRPFVSGEVNVSQVAWTPDGRSISFLAKRGSDDNQSLYVIPRDGGESRRILSHGTDITHYSWSPDGKQVAFLAAEALPKEEKELRDKGFNQEIYEEDFRPVKVWVAEPEEEDSKPRALDLPGSANQLHWSPVDSRLMVALAPTPLIDDTFMKSRVHVVDAGTGEVLVRIDNPGKLGPVAWSPDGLHLALLSGADLHDPGTSRLKVVPSSGGPLEDLVPGYKGDVESFSWLDIDRLLFAASEGVWRNVQEIDREGKNRRTLVPKETPIWRDVTTARQGWPVSVVADSPEHPAEVFFLEREGSEPQRLTSSNPWLEDIRMARHEVVQYRARDGLELEGLLVRPLDERPGQRYPLILMVHGGPEAHYSNGWLTSYTAPGQLGAARGFAVFYPNYRGSTGLGVEFSKLGQADPAGKEFDDLVDGVDHLIEAGLVDRDRVGITGGSYGGYATAWGATYYTERFAAGVMFVGISNHISKSGTSDIPEELYLVHARRRLWEDWDFFLKRSPIHYVEQARTPLLILHGKADPRVHPAQSLEIHRHLKTLGKAPVRLIFYPGEGHGNRRAASRLDYTLRLMQWMEHYLIGPGGDPPPYTLEYEPAEAP